MFKAFFLCFMFLTFSACAPSNIHQRWEDGNLTKREYLRRKIARAESEKTIKNTFNGFFNSQW